MLVQEAYQERRIGEIARQIADRKDVRFALTAGPSSSGKTTFSHIGCPFSLVNGLKPHPIAVDNYLSIGNILRKIQMEIMILSVWKQSIFPNLMKI